MKKTELNPSPKTPFDLGSLNPPNHLSLAKKLGQEARKWLNPEALLPSQFHKESLSASQAQVPSKQEITTVPGPQPQPLDSGKLMLSTSLLLPGEADHLEGWALFEKCQYRLAQPYFEKGAKAGYPPSYLWLIWLYSSGGRIGSKDLEKSQHYSDLAAKCFPWFLQAAQSGKAHDQCNLGTCYATGCGVTQTDTKAVEWFNKAAEQGNAHAQFNLGTCYATSRGVTQNDLQAVEWFSKSAEQGNTHAQFNLGICYAKGQGVTQDHVHAFKWFYKAAEQGLAIAQSNLAACYTKGQGVTQDHAQAFEWLCKAAEQGLAIAQSNLGACYAKGRGVTLDYAQAFEWFRRAAEQGLAMAQFNLGACYAKGQGVTQDYSQAIRWFYKAAEQGDASAQRYFKKLMQRYPQLNASATTQPTAFFTQTNQPPALNLNNSTPSPHDSEAAQETKRVRQTPPSPT